MLSQELRLFAEEHLKQLFFRHPLSYVPVLVWKKFRVTAGMAYYREGAIGLSVSVLSNRQEIEETVGHEYAHLLAYDQVGKRGVGHGADWKRAMMDLGLEPKVRHNYRVERNTRHQQVDYICLRCGSMIVRRRRLPCRKKFVHAQCGGDLKLLRVSKVT